MVKRVLQIDNQIEALRIKEILDENGIPHMIRNYHDSALDGLFQNNLGWGVLEAEEADEPRILELLKVNVPDIGPDENSDIV
ncbi:MAG TPA: DUF2007 domain-containing protein [Bacteroidales bacterium]|nr:DUF2007 domain-containing protein [Bacteroidales bacterium]